ncbi:hypothetical protein FB451DRAFT_1292386 [Mycena latifolia]|nr:hypothetical protein FB451DRAFT_1292386 [Mycena latifolia]
MTVTRRLHRANMRLRKLAESGHADAVRAWEFYGSLSLSDLPGMYSNVLHMHLVPETYDNMVQRFTSTLGAYRNLRALHVSRFEIDSAFRDTLSSLGQLESLHMTDCDISARTGHLLPLHTLSLTTDLTSSDTETEPLQIVSPETLRTLTIDDSRDACAFLSSLSSGNLNNLVHLNIRLSALLTDRSLAFGFLKRCAHVTHIEISHLSTLSGTLPSRLPPAVIPNVISFKGPPTLGGLITFNRPVSAVTFSSPFHGASQAIQALGAITHASVSLRALSLQIPIEATADVCAAITQNFPDLRELSLGLLTANPPPSRRPQSDVDRFIELAKSCDPDEYEHDPNALLADWNMARDADSEEREHREYRDLMFSEKTDERTLYLLDNDSVESIASPDPDLPRLLPGPFVGGIVEGIPDIRTPGYIYTMSGRSFPPQGTLGKWVSESQVIVDSQDPRAVRSIPPVLIATQGPIHALLSSISKGRGFPAGLVTMRLMSGLRGGVHSGRISAFTLFSQQQAVLGLEQRLPALRQLAFAEQRGEDSVWVRDGDVWRQRANGTIIASMGP